MKVMITGGAGFIGSHLAEKLLEEGAEVFVLDDLSTGSINNIAKIKNNPKFHFTKASVTDAKIVSKLIKRVDAVYHLAAAVGVKYVVEHPLHSLQVNIIGTENVLEMATKEKKKVLIASSSEVYGKSTDIPLKEESDRILGPTTISRWGYSCSKAIDEFLALAYNKEKGLPVVITRFFNTVGPRQSGSYGMVIPNMVQNALSNKPILVYGDGKQTRCFCHVNDVIKAITSLMETEKAKGEIFNVGSTEEISIKALAEKIKIKTNSDSQIEYVPFEKVYGKNFEDMNRRVPDITKLKSVIKDFNPRPLDKTLNDIIDYFKEKHN